MNRLHFLWLTGFGLISLKARGQQGLPDNISTVFEGIKANLPATLKIAANDEPGQRIIIRGRVFESDRKTPAANVKMYFYHTNEKGIYAKHGNEPRNSYAWWHGYNRGYLITNAKGEYMINTIKPGTYPSRADPAHIHVIVMAPSQGRVYDMGAITFKGDELATDAYWRLVQQNGHPNDGGTALKMSNGIMTGYRNFVLYKKYDR